MRDWALLRRFLLGVVIVVAVVAAAASARPQATAPATAASGFVAAPKPGQPPFPDCPAFGVIGSRGSGENNPKDSGWGQGLGPPNLAFAKALAKRLPGVQYTYNPSPAYPAVSAATAAVRFSKYKASVSTGEAQLLAMVALQRGSCGAKTKILLAGYSQGAELTGNTYLTELQTSPKNTALIAGVVLFADPRYNLNDPSDVQTKLQRSQHANLHHNGALTLRGRYYAGPPHNFPASTAGKVLSYCLINDLICQGIGGNPFSHQHSAYPANGAPTDAATWLAERLSGGGGAAPAVDLAAVARGDFSSLAGSWTEKAFAINPMDGTGSQWYSPSPANKNTLTVTPRKLVFGPPKYAVVFTHEGLTAHPSGSTLLRLRWTLHNNVLEAVPVDDAAILFWLTIFPVYRQQAGPYCICPNNGITIAARPTIELGSSGGGENVFQR